MGVKSILPFRVLAPALLGALILSTACGSDSKTTPDGGETVLVGDGGVVIGECGELSEGQGECEIGRELHVCENNQLVQYECPAGSLCDDASDNVGCYCDNIDDGFCPDTTCTEDPNCGVVECTVTATAMRRVDQSVMDGVGIIQCNGPTNLEAEVCIQLKASTEFNDVQCFTQSMGSVQELRVENAVGCTLQKNRLFRTRVTAFVNDVAQEEVVSDEVTCEEVE